MLLSVAGAIIIAVAFFAYNYGFCGYAREIKAYSQLRNNAFYFGKKACPAVWNINSKTIQEIQELDKEKKAEIMVKIENEEIEKILEDKFIGFSKYRAGEGANSFVIYETICSQCELIK